jgi:hypothetical protein
MWKKEHLQTQDPSESPPSQLGSQTRFIQEERIDVVRKVANSREERDKLKAELETLFAEKREMVKVDTWAVEREDLAQKKRDKKIDLAAKLGFWTAVALALLLFLYFIGPLTRACRAL